MRGGAAGVPSRVSPVAAAIVPLTLLIALGFALRRAAFLPEPFWPGLDRLNYWVLFPALIFVSLATARGSLDGSGRVALARFAGRHPLRVPAEQVDPLIMFQTLLALVWLPLAFAVAGRMLASP